MMTDPKNTPASANEYNFFIRVGELLQDSPYSLSPSSDPRVVHLSTTYRGEAVSADITDETVEVLQKASDDLAAVSKLARALYTPLLFVSRVKGLHLTPEPKAVYLGRRRLSKKQSQAIVDLFA